MASRSINVGELIDTGKMSAFQYWVLALCICVNFIDGYDVQSMAYVGPAIVKGWHVSKAVITPALTIRSGRSRPCASLPAWASAAPIPMRCR